MKRINQKALANFHDHLILQGFEEATLRTIVDLVRLRVSHSSGPNFDSNVDACIVDVRRSIMDTVQVVFDGFIEDYDSVEDEK